MNIPTNLKLIASGNMPNTATLQKGEMAFGKVPLSGNIRLFVNDGGSTVAELPLSYPATSSMIGGVMVNTNSGLRVNTDGQISLNISQTTGTSIIQTMSQNAITAALNIKANTSSLANVAISGNYNDLLNIPVIPNAQVQVDWLGSGAGLNTIANQPNIHQGKRIKP